MNKAAVFAGVIALAGASSAMAQATLDLKVTEIWAGVAGSDHTKDWFELTNFSTTTSYSLAGYLVNDNSGGLGTAVAIAGVTSIAPGESLIVLMEGTTLDVTTFRNVWGLTGSPVQVGYADGSGLGLGQSGDAVQLYSGGSLITQQAYPSYDETNYGSFVWNNDTNSWDNSRAVAGVWGAYNSVVTAGNANAPAIGSPGVTIPAPGALALAGVAGLAGVRRRR